MPDRSPDLRALDRIMQELQHAESKHPGWPTDPVRRAAILVEEAGEVMKATLDEVESREYVERKHGIELPNTKPSEDLIKEVAQTGAMALRYLINYEREWNR